MSSEIKADKWSPASGTSATIGDSGDTYTIPSGVTFTNNGTATGFGDSLRPNVNPLIINGNMAVAQRGTSTSSITGGGYYTVDRWKLNMSSLGTWTQTQNTLSSSDTPFTYGFTKSLKMDCTTADGSPGVNDDCQIYYLPEGQDLQLLKKGTANAEKITIGFWIKATKTGTNILAIYDRDNNRLNSQSYSVSSSDTWEYKVVNFPADTTGVIDNDNNKSFELRWVLGLGSTYTSGTLQTTWATYSDANYGVGQVNNGDSTSNNWEITGVQMEVGEYTSSTLPPFQHESYGDNLQRCQRYYEKSFEQGTTPAAGTSAPDGRVFGSWDGASARTQIDFATTKRASPTVTVYRGSNTGSGTATGTANFIYSGAWNNHTCVSNHADDSQVSLTGSTSNFTTNGAFVADMNFTADAEL